MQERSVFPHFSGVTSVVVHEEECEGNVINERDIWVDLATMSVTKAYLRKTVMEERALAASELSEDDVARAVESASRWLAENPGYEVVDVRQAGRLL